MEQLIVYIVRRRYAGDLLERGECTTEQWERQRKQEVHERYKGLNYQVRLWPPQKWWRRGNDQP